MSQTKNLSLVAGAGISLFAVSAMAQTASYTQNSDEVRAIVSEMLSDAQNRSSLLASGGGAGHDNSGFFIGDASGNFRLNVGGQIQFRYYLNFRDTQDGGPNALPNRGNDDFESGFQTSNTRIWFNGNIVDPNLFYNVIGNFSESTGNFNLEEAYAGYKWDNGFSMQWGQFVLPFMREKLVAGWYQLAVDRSLTDLTFDQGYSQGVQLGYSSDMWRLAVAFSDGFRSANSEFGSVNGFGDFGFTNGGGESDWALTGRVEIKFAGTWDQFKQFTSMPESEFGAMLGVAGHIEGSANDIATTDANGNATQGDTTLSAWTADLSLLGDGWNFYLAGNGAYANNSGNGLDNDTADYGVVVQGGIFIPNTDWEIYARYDVIFPDDSRTGQTGDSGNDSFSTVTVGTNYYWSGQAAKFTFDVQYFIDNASDGLQTTANGDAAIGYLGSGEDGEVTLRFQFQLLF